MTYRFKDLVDIPKLQELTDQLYTATSIPSGIITTEGEVLTASGWQRICTDFHRKHPAIERECIKSDTELKRKLDDGDPFSVYRCPRGLVDASSPIVIAGQHVANVFVGQVFLDPPDETTEEFFVRQAEKFGFNEKEYIEAFKEIPVFTEKTFRAAITFLATLAQMIAGMGLTRRNELEAIEGLHASEEQFRLITETVREVFWVGSSDWRELQYVSPAYEDVWGRSCQSLHDEPRSWLDSVHSEDRAGVLATIERGFSGEPVSHEFAPYRVVRPDGSERWILARAYPIYDADGNVDRIVGIAEDITKRINAEEALKASEQTLRAILDNSPISMWCFDGERYTFLSREWFRYTGCDLSLPVTTDTWVELIHPEDVEEAVGIWDAHWKNKTKHENNFRVKKADGTYRSFHCYSFPVFDAKGHFRYFHGYNFDTTEQLETEKKRQRLEEQLQQAHKMEAIGTLAGGIARDFNNILFPIVGHAELLLEEISEGSPFRAGLSEIHSGALRARELVKQILTFSRPDAGAQRVMRIQPIIEEVLKLIRPLIPTTIEIKQEIQSGCGAIEADPTEIHQIMMNLATNAYQAMIDLGGVLEVRLDEVESSVDGPKGSINGPGVYARITVSDTGVGMSKDTAEKIFDPFFTTKQEDKGTGMGLAVVHGIVTGAGGSIHVHSAPGKGTKFHVYLPVVETPQSKRETG